TTRAVLPHNRTPGTHPSANATSDPTVLTSLSQPLSIGSPAVQSTPPLHSRPPSPSPLHRHPRLLRPPRRRRRPTPLLRRRRRQPLWRRAALLLPSQAAAAVTKAAPPSSDSNADLDGKEPMNGKTNRVAAAAIAVTAVV